MEKPHISLSEALQGTEAEMAAEVAATDDSAESSNEKTTPQTSDGIVDEIARAEQRGYLRGRNEAIAEQMHKPGLWEEPEPRHSVSILGNLRRGVWD